MAERKFDRVLFALTKGGVGDLLASTPVADAIKSAYPNAKITAWVNPRFRELLTNHPSFDGFFDIEYSSGFAEQLRAIKAAKFDAAVIPWSASRLAWLAFAAGIPVRAGQGGRLSYSFLFSHKVSVRGERGDTQSHWVECQLDYARAIGIDAGKIAPKIYLADAEKARGREILEEAGVDAGSKVCIISPGKGMNLTPQRWPVERIAEAADMIIEHSGAQVVLTGSPGEIDISNAVIDKMKSRCFDLTGKTTLRELAMAVANADAMVCPDSGPVHIAAALGVPTVSIFALKSDFPQRWRPYGVPYKIVRPANIACDDGCVKETCKYFKCLLQIDPEEVCAGAIELMNKQVNG